MKSHKNFFLPLLLVLFTLSALSAQDPGKDQADKMAEEAKELADNIPAKDKAAKQAADEVAEAIKKAGEDHPKDADKVKKAVEDKLKEIRDRKSKTGAPGGDKKEVKELIKNLLKALFGSEGEAAAGKIKEELDGTGLDLDGNSENDERDRIKKAADDAAEKDPHDPKAVKDAVKKKIEEEMEKGKNNKSILDWLKRVREWLKGKNLLVSVVTPSSDVEWIAATGTGRTTGHVATLTVHNPQPTAITAEISACFIPSEDKKQPYITLPTSVRLLPGETLQVALQGYCADVFAPPVPNGHPMPPVSDWIRYDELLSDITVPMVNTSERSANVFGSISNPREVGPVLMKALEQIAQAYDALEASGAINTPFSGDPQKQQTSILQNVLWVYEAALSGKEYRQEDFRANIIEQYETSSGHSFKKASQEDKENLETGVAQFWGTFKLVGEEAKVLSTNSK
ncbi:MAG: hypothetical protein Q7T20_00015 [Saprospiraceae bacterium]|nr:hypothetical protein [Saprospiraceae bacterium]